MSIRIILHGLMVIILCFYARKDWFIALCGAILLMAVQEHSDFRGSMFGMPGMNPWNILLLNILLAWLANRRKEGLVLDTPLNIKASFLVSLTIVNISIFRLLLDPGNVRDMEGYSYTYLLNEFFLNPIKWIIPGLLFYYGCNTRKRVLIALGTISGLYVLLAIQVFRYLPISAITDEGAALAHLAAKIIMREIGYSRVSMAMMLSGAFWAVISAGSYSPKLIHRFATIALAGMIFVGLALTGGRTGYATWVIVGLILCIARWRRLLLLIPVAAVIIVLLFPSIQDRMLMGFADKSGPIVTRDNEDAITSGRSLIWPYVIQKIGESPIIGYGRLAMIRTGLHKRVSEEIFGEADFAHPHNAYLEILLDAGYIGLLGVMIFFIVILWHSFRLLLDRKDSLFGAVGGFAAALLLSLLIAGIGSHHFYPESNGVGTWAAIGVMFRVYVERLRWKKEGSALFAHTLNITNGENIVSPINMLPRPQ